MGRGGGGEGAEAKGSKRAQCEERKKEEGKSAIN